MNHSFRAICGAIAFLALVSGAALADVTVLGWPGGPEEVALRKAAEVYNAKTDVSDKDKVKLIFFNRDGFFDKLQADLAAGSKDFDVNLLATYAIGRYAPFMDPVACPPRRKTSSTTRCSPRCSIRASNTGCRPTSRCTLCTTART